MKPTQIVFKLTVLLSLIRINLLIVVKLLQMSHKLEMAAQVQPDPMQSLSSPQRTPLLHGELDHSQPAHHRYAHTRMEANSPLKCSSACASDLLSAHQHPLATAHRHNKTTGK